MLDYYMKLQALYGLGGVSGIITQHVELKERLHVPDDLEHIAKKHWEIAMHIEKSWIHTPASVRFEQSCARLETYYKAHTRDK